MINFKNTQNLTMGGCHEMYNILFLQVHFLKKKVFVVYICHLPVSNTTESN